LHTLEKGRKRMIGKRNEIERVDGQWAKIDGTYLQGHLHNTSYDEIVAILGEPTTRPIGDKVDADWAFEVDGIVVTIHNWKDGQNYNGPTSPPVEQLRLWSIGGHNAKAAKTAKELFPQFKLIPRRNNYGGY